MIKLVGKKCPNSLPTDILQLNLQLSKEDQFSIIWIISNVLENIWQARKTKKLTLAMIRADIESKVIALRKSRLVREADAIWELTFK